MKTPPRVLVVGSGLAGLALALKLASDYEVHVLSKSELPASNTAMAQGGIAAVFDAKDSFDSHVADTLTAGAGLCRESVVHTMIEQAPARIADLIQWGVRFDRIPGGNNFDLTREGGHQARRILHHADQTGAEIHFQLLERARKTANIFLHPYHHAVDLILDGGRCVGAFVLDQSTGQVTPWLASACVLATGGAGKVYLYTSNWAGATGDGVALAARAGCRITNLEFTQFHPTCLYHPEARNFLISEALRGEGGVLRNQKGFAFMAQYHPLKELAPRDIVARAIDTEMKKSGEACVYLDMTHLDGAFLKARFPAIYEQCLHFGIDMTKAPIPVVPAAHYLCGGIETTPSGQTDIPRLFAIGETACSGLHGANRLASNSLLECIAMAHMCAQTLVEEHAPQPKMDPKFLWQRQDQPDPDELVIIAHTWDEIRRLMWNYVGIVRSNRRLESARRRLETIWKEVEDYERKFKIHADIIELRNITIVASLIVNSALNRKESRGIHFSLDYPQELALAQDTILRWPN